MKESKQKIENNGVRIPINTALAFSVICLAGLTVAMKQNGFQGAELFDHRFFTVKLATLTVFNSILKIYNDSKRVLKDKSDFERTKKLKREVIAEGLIGIASGLSQYFIY